MTKIRGSKKLTFLLVAVAVMACMSIQAFAASLTVVEIWKPNTPYQATSPNTVYMDHDSSAWGTTGDHIEKIAWKFFDPAYNPDITTAGACKAAQYVGNDSSNPLAYSYDFDAADIKSDLLNVQPYYLDIKIDKIGSANFVDMGCRTVFPATMEVKIPVTDLSGNVTVAYVSGSCDGYAKHKATDWNQIQDNNYGDPNYLDNHPYKNQFDVFTNTTVPVVNGYVTFTTDHGGEYWIY